MFKNLMQELRVQFPFVLQAHQDTPYPKDTVRVYVIHGPVGPLTTKGRQQDLKFCFDSFSDSQDKSLEMIISVQEYLLQNKIVGIEVDPTSFTKIQDLSYIQANKERYRYYFDFEAFGFRGDGTNGI